MKKHISAVCLSVLLFTCLFSPASHTKEEKEKNKLKKEFKGIQLFPVEEKDYAVYFKWLKEAEKKGWLNEFNEIMKNAPKPGEKKDSRYKVGGEK